MRRPCVASDVLDAGAATFGSLGVLLLSVVVPKTLITSSQSIRAEMPSIRMAASRAITSASVDECDTAPCFLHSHCNTTNVFGPTKQSMAPVVDFESLNLLQRKHRHIEPILCLLLYLRCSIEESNLWSVPCSKFIYTIFCRLLLSTWLRFEQGD